MDVKKMSNYSLTQQKESKTLVFFYGVYLTNGEKEKNERCFMKYEEARDYFESLEIEDGFYKRIDEYFINSDENTMGNYGNCRFEGDLELINKLDKKYNN